MDDEPKKYETDFDREWQRSMRVARIYGILAVLFNLILLAVLAWLVIILLRFFGVV